MVLNNQRWIIHQWIITKMVEPMINWYSIFWLTGPNWWHNRSIPDGSISSFPKDKAENHSSEGEILKCTNVQNFTKTGYTKMHQDALNLYSVYRGAHIRTGQKYEWLVHFFYFVFVWLVQSGPSKIFWPVHLCNRKMFSGPSLYATPL